MSGGYCLAGVVLQQIYSKLTDIDQKVSAPLLKEEKPTAEELRAIKLGKKQFSEGLFRPWKEVSASLK